jgi:putative Ca2+/H+ antiporter (TMEM165/GDT1 family)
MTKRLNLKRQKNMNQDGALKSCVGYENSESVKIMATIFCTEMGDRSQFAAISIAANYDFWIVALAGSIGHILVLIVAILFGKAVSH